MISLNTFPSVAPPAYWVLGRSQFNSYIKARQEDELDLSSIAAKIRKESGKLELSEKSTPFFDWLSHQTKNHHFVHISKIPIMGD